MSSTITESAVARANAARNEAIKKIIENHQDEYNEILLEERKDRGLFGLPGARKQTIKDQLGEAKQEIERLTKLAISNGIQP